VPLQEGFAIDRILINGSGVETGDGSDIQRAHGKAAHMLWSTGMCVCVCSVVIRYSGAFAFE
jgi:hypothetical protein